MTIQNSKFKIGLNDAIIKTVIFYDIIGLPLTAFEIQKYLIRDSSFKFHDSKLELSDVLEALESGDYRKFLVGEPVKPVFRKYN